MQDGIDQATGARAEEPVWLVRAVLILLLIGLAGYFGRLLYIMLRSV